MHREHPLRIVRYSIKNIWLLIFPLLRNLMSLRTTPEEVFRWIRGSWFDLLILLLILGFGWIRWYCSGFSLEGGDICVHEGIFLRRSRYFPTHRLSSLTLEHPFWLRPLQGVYLYADTASGGRRSGDLRLLIRRADAERFHHAMPKLRYGCRCSRHYKVRPLRILLFSVIFSSSLSGSLYAAAFWFQGGRISRDLIEEFGLVQKIGAVSEEVARHLYGISPAAVTVGIVILSTWLLSLINNLLRYGGFCLETDGELHFVRSGILTKRSFRLRCCKINFIDIRQNLLTKLFGVFSLAVNCPGYGSKHGTIPVCLPILRGHELDEALPLLFPHAKRMPNMLRPPLTAWWGYIWMPVLCAAAVVPTSVLLRHLFPRFGDVIGFLQLMLLIPIGWKLAVQVASLLTSGVSVTGSHLCLRYCRGFGFHTIIAGRQQLAKVTLRRNPWQRMFRKCDIVFCFRSELPVRCVLRNVDYEAAEEMFGGSIRK